MLDPPPTHGITWREVAKDFSINLRTLTKWVKRGYLKKLGNKHIDPECRTSILPKWKSTCTFREAARKLSVSINTVSNWRRKNILETVIIPGHERVTLASIEMVILKASEKKEQVQRLKKIKEEKNMRRKELRASSGPRKRKRATQQPFVIIKRVLPPPIPKLLDYKPVQADGFASKKLTNLEEASRATGENPQLLRELFRKGAMRGEIRDEETYLYISSVEARQSKINRGIKLTR